MKSIFRRVVATVGACAVIVGMSTSVSHAAEPGNVVMFGDSFFANPSYSQVAGWRGDLARTNSSSFSGIDSHPGRPSPQGCPQGALTIGTELSRMTGKKVNNYACSAAKASGQSFRSDLSEQISGAIKNGHLTPRTSNVLVQLGANDAPNILSSAFTHNSYKKSMVKAARSIRTVAPQAKITFVGYPAISAGNGAVCPVRDVSHGVGFNVDYLRLFSSLEKTIDHAMYEAANEAGVRFFDTRSVTLHNNMCAPNEIRWVAGVWESGLPHNLYNHLTHAGVTGVARLLKNEVIDR